MKIDDKTLYNSSPEIVAKHCTGGKFIFRPFQTYISEIITNEIIKGNARIILSVPPQHGKSEVASHWVPVWFLSNFPDRHIMLLSYNENYACGWGRIVRNSIRKNKDKLFVELSTDSTAAGYWHSSAGGSMMCSGVDGTMTGRPGHVIIIDDPHKNWAEAMSESRRQKVIEWYTKTVTQRFQKDTTVIVIQTRWHKQDLAGFLLKHGVDKWKEIRLAALAEKNDPLGRKEGEPLLPQEYSKATLEKRKIEMGAMAFAAIYQQSPQVEDGNVFKRQYWQRYVLDAKPKSFDRIIHSWDTAFEAKKTSAYTACTTWGQYQKRLYLLSIWREKADYPTVKRKMFDLYHSEKASLILLEDKATGKPLRQELRLAGLPIIEVNPTADKYTRACSVTPLFEDGRVFIAAGETWADDVIAGCAEFPNGDWTDVVDTISQGLTFLAITDGGGLCAGDLLVGKSGRTFRFGKSLSGFSIREKPHWYRDYASRSGGRYV